MDKNYNVLLQLLCLFIIFTFTALKGNAQVGIGTTTPNAQLEVLSLTSTGNTLRINHLGVANGNSSAWIRNMGLGSGISLQSLNTANNTAGMRIDQFGTGGNANGLEIFMTGGTISEGLTIFNDGAGSGIYNQLNGTSTFGIINDLTNHGGFGSFVDLSFHDGIGYSVSAVDNIVTPTIGGDVFAFDGSVFTTTPSGAFINGAVLSGQQYGVGHGAIITHSGTAGRNAEFNITNTANTDAAIFSAHLGQGSAIIAQNQNNVITGTVYAADFAYTGTDVTDHVGVSGYSEPVAGWGIGALGQGGWYGIFSLGNTGATGVKAFTIDHPEDPANKILKHFSIESNEVLNIYRGTEVFDGNGKATVSLPDYYGSINKNPSYQLTPIGAAMPNLYIESEIGNGQFVIAGGVANKKVSWQITAERNDPYLQQNPAQRETVVIKEGERSGKYLTPELYGQPKEKGMFYNKNRKKQKASKINNSNAKKLENIRAERPKPTKVIEEEQVQGKQ